MIRKTPKLRKGRFPLRNAPAKPVNLGTMGVDRAIADRLTRFCAEAGRLDVATHLRLVTSIPDIMTRGSRREFHRSINRAAAAPGIVLQIKRHARLVFPDPSREGRLITAKIGLPFKNKGCLAREIKARKLLARWGVQVPVPELLRYDVRRVWWLEEEYIPENKTITDSDKLKLFLTRYAIRLYAPTVRSCPVSISLRRFHIAMSQLRDVLREAKTEIWGTDEEVTWPMALLHGDVGASNMIVDQDDRFFLVDWEGCTTGPVAWDLIRLFQREPELVHNILRDLGQPSDISPANQIHVLSAVKLIRGRRAGIIDSAIEGLLARGINLPAAPRQVVYSKIREFARQELDTDATGYPDRVIQGRLRRMLRKWDLVLEG
jgi:hypothetical protein